MVDPRPLDTRVVVTQKRKYLNAIRSEWTPDSRKVCGAWWLSSKCSAFRPEGRRFKSHSGRYVGTLGKSFTHSCLQRFGMLTSTHYQCCSQEHRHYRNVRNE